MLIETDRLFLREMKESDYDALYTVLADSDIMQHYSYTFDETRVKGWISRNIERYQIFGFGLWAICLKENSEMIGDCGLTMQLIGGQIKPEIGYHIRKDQQRKGYAKEAAIAVRNWTFEHTPFNVIYSYMKYTNVPSYSTAISYGCHQVDEFKDEVNEITKVFAITRAEWIGICMLGNIVNVTVDRPLGSYHPEHKDMYYPINYGFVDGIIAPDGEEQDVYIIGVEKAVEKFSGKIIAIIHRNDDVEEKWVAAPEGMTFSEKEIMEQVYFQEQYFDSEIRLWKGM